jgi:signal transduction histidine kinase
VHLRSLAAVALTVSAAVTPLVLMARPTTVLLHADLTLPSSSSDPLVSVVPDAAQSRWTSTPVGAANAPAWRADVEAGDAAPLLVSTRVTELGWTDASQRPRSASFGAAGRWRQQVLGAFGFSLAILAAAGVWLGRRFVAPVRHIQRATQALALGDFRTRLKLGGPDDIRGLADSCNDVAARLRALQDDMKRQERQATSGRAFAGLCHDLNLSIQNIGNNARLLLRADLDPDVRIAVHHTLEREFNTLRRFLDDVLHVARPRPLDRFPVDVNASVADVLDAMRAEAAEAGVVLSGRLASDAPAIDGDRFALARVYRNLLTNALQATCAGGHVAVATERRGRVVEIRVTDTGVGIASDRLAQIFDDFVTTKRRGLGLGLATSRRIVEQLGGTIAVASELGRGTTFTLQFPASAAHVVEAAS